jgi:hypothetical protein
MHWIGLCLVVLAGCASHSIQWKPPRGMDAKQALQIQYACKHGAASYGAMTHGMQIPQPPPNVLAPQGPIGPPGSGAIYAGA